MTLATLGYGDITPANTWLRLLAPLEALIGFVLLTAGISWVLSIYPVLAQRRAFAHEVTLLRESEEATGVRVAAIGANAAERLLGNLTAQVIAVRGGLTQFPVTYYFHGDDDRTAPAAALPYLLTLVEQASRPECAPAVRLRAAGLRGALDDFAAILAVRFLDLKPGNTVQVLHAYAHDHQRAGGDAHP